MSTRRGANVRSRPQKYKNRTAFKNDLHDKTPQIKFINSLHISEVCGHCKSVIEWKIKYKKYKPLSQPKTCNKCGQRTVKKAYHVYCRDCALKYKVCAKCNKSAEEVAIEPPGPTPEEKIKLEAEMQQLIKKLPERKRRTFLRYMQKGKKAESTQNEGEDGEEQENAEEKEVESVPRTRDELLKKIEELKVSNDSDDDEDPFGSDLDDEYDFGDEEDDCEEEEEDEESDVDVKYSK